MVTVVPCSIGNGVYESVPVSESKTTTPPASPPTLTISITPIVSESLFGK